MASPIKYNASFQQTKSLSNETNQFNNSLMKIAKPTSVYFNNKLLEQQEQFNKERDNNTGKMLEAVMNGTTVPEFDNYDPNRFAKGKLDIDKVQSAIDLNNINIKSKKKSLSFADQNQEMKVEKHNVDVQVQKHGMDHKDRTHSLNAANVGSQIATRNSDLSMRKSEHNLKVKQYNREQQADLAAMLASQAASTTEVDKFSDSKARDIVAAKVRKRVAGLEAYVEDTTRDLEDQKANDRSAILDHVMSLRDKMVNETDPVKSQAYKQELISYDNAVQGLEEQYDQEIESLELDKLDQLNEIQDGAKKYYKDLANKKVSVSSTPQQYANNLKELMNQVDDPIVYKEIKREYEKASKEAALISKGTRDSQKEVLETTMKVEKHNAEMKKLNKESRSSNTKTTGNAITANVAIKKIFDIDDNDTSLQSSMNKVLISKLKLYGVKPPYTQKVITESIERFGMDKDSLMDQALKGS